MQLQIDGLQILFLVAAGATLLASVMVVANRNLFHSALWLVVALFGVAALFALLEAGFLAIAQVVVYIGAIATLIIFAVMLTRRVMQPAPEAANTDWPLAVGAAILLFILLAAPLSPFFLGMVLRVDEWAHAAIPTTPVGPDSLAALGRALVDMSAPFGAYAVPFEVASVLLLGALVGAIVIASDKKSH